jgi:hypothetical protein
MEEHQLLKFNYEVKELFDFIYGIGYKIYLLDFHYPSDHICVHSDNLDEFIKINNEYIRPLTETNNLNHNLENGVTEKIIQ